MRWLSIVAACLLALVPLAADAHAIIMESLPATNAIVTGADIGVSLRYNSRVDHTRSTIKLLGPDKQVRSLAVSDKSTDDTLITSITGLTPGKYRLRWQVLSVDGHITRGDIPFTDVAAGPTP